MSQLAWIQGANLQETCRFSKVRNAVAGPIGDIRKDDETASICFVNPLERATSPSGAAFLAYFRGFSAILILFMGP